MSVMTLVDAAAAIVGADSVRPGTSVDAIDGVTPQVVVEPADAESVASILRWASRDQLSTLTRGAGTKLGWGAPPRSIDVLISTSRLNSVVAHRHGDLTATIQAGAALGDVNRALSRHRQWIPLDPPGSDRATIGGIVATNDSGPRRHRYGAPRDLIIGVEFARADGQLAKGGGIVVKNVAGYDLPRLMTGSFGSLAVIVTATFKLYPLAAASRTLVVDLRGPKDLGELVGKILSSHLTPSALEFQTPPLRLLIRFESIEAAVDQQCATAAALIGESGLVSRDVWDAEEEQLWNEHNLSSGGNRHDAGLAVKVSVVPTELGDTLALIERLAGGTDYRAIGRAGLGVFRLYLGRHSDVQPVLEGLRGILTAGRGSAAVVAGPPELRSKLDVWGPVGTALPLMRAVKQKFDPAGILNPGRGPGGI